MQHIWGWSHQHCVQLPGREHDQLPRGRLHVVRRARKRDWVTVQVLPVVGETDRTY